MLACLVLLTPRKVRPEGQERPTKHNDSGRIPRGRLWAREFVLRVMR